MPPAVTSGAPIDREPVSRRLLRALMLPAAFLCAATLLLLGEVRYLVSSLGRVDHSHEVIAQIEDLQLLFTEMETGLRAYAATGSEELLQPYTESEQRVSGEFDQIAQLVSDNPGQSARIARLRTSFAQWMEYAGELLGDRMKQGSLQKGRLAEQMTRGKRLMDDMRAQVQAFKDTEDQLRKARVRRAQATEYVVFATAILLAVAGWLMFAVRTSRQVRNIVETHTLRATNKQLEALVKNAPVGLAMFDREMRYLRASQHWVEEVGLASTDLAGRSHYETFPNLPQHFIEAHSRGLAGEMVSGEDDWINVNGERRSSRWIVQPYGEPGVAPSGIIIATEDTTERKRKETELRESEERFRALVEHASDGFVIHDMDGRLIEVNQQTCESLGYTREELLSMNVFDIEQDFDLEVGRRVWGELTPSNAHTVLGHLRRKDGTLFPHEARLSTYQIRDRQFVLGLVRDITERRQVETKLRESEATVRALLDTASQAIIAVDTTGAIVLANRMVGDMFGYAPADLIGKALEVLVPARFRRAHEAHRNQFNCYPSNRFMGIGSELELMGLRSDGAEFPVEVSLSSIETKHGVLAVSFVSDITARKHSETALRESEQKLRLLAGGLLTAQEDERRSLARELHDDITQQLAFLSILLGKLAADLPDSDTRVRPRVQNLQAQALRASNDVRRLSHGLHPAFISDFGLSVAVQELCEDFRRVHGVTIEFKGLPDDRRLSDSQAGSLYRIAQESMRNAVQHGRATELSLSLSLVDGSVALKVVDNGVGFNTGKLNGKAGLGIISMTERMRLAGGTLNIVSSFGSGTEVTASLPVNRIEHESSASTVG
jgi:PAS domain S-box-containing protein